MVHNTISTNCTECIFLSSEIVYRICFFFLELDHSKKITDEYRVNQFEPDYYHSILNDHNSRSSLHIQRPYLSWKMLLVRVRTGVFFFILFSNWVAMIFFFEYWIKPRRIYEILYTGTESAFWYCMFDKPKSNGITRYDIYIALLYDLFLSISHAHLYASI